MDRVGGFFFMSEHAVLGEILERYKGFILIQLPGNIRDAIVV